MKKILSLAFTLLGYLSYSQSITVNTSTYNDFGLVNNVLVNSPCVNISNVSSRTGTNYGSTNGIGYFENTNPAFPFANGVVLTTGNVLNAVGPNTSELNDGSLAWLGDTQLETTLAASGITMNSKNATVLEFDFTTYSNYFNFQFIFASEEYGTYQCKSTDGFAFLLTDASGSTENLAVIPSTTTPISVQTIRNNLFNSDCSSENTSYFGSFNGGSSATSSASNFNGQTVLMNATKTNLIPGQTYHIRIVIADGIDNLSDSALFLGGSSFDFSQDVLGPDISNLCNNNGVNEPYTITSGLDPNFFDFVWKDVNGNPIPGATGPDLTVNQPGTYQLTYYIQATNCEVATNDIIINYQLPPNTPNPIDLYKCDNGAATYIFDLNQNNSVINPSGQYQLSYHETLVNADINTNSLPLSYSVNTSDLPKEIWVRITDPNNGCYAVKSFFLRLTASPQANNPGDFTSCETAMGSGLGSFDLASLTPTVLGTQSSATYTVSYHLSQSDADNDNNPIDINTDYTSSNSSIFIRIENNTDANCFNTTSINLIVKPRPILDTIPNQYVCTEYILPNLINPGTYYTGPNQTGSILNAGTAITTDSVIYIYHETGGSPSCSSEYSFTVTIVDLNDITPPGVTACDSYVIQGYPIEGMRYFKLPGGPTVPNNIEVVPGEVISNLGTTTLYVYFTFTDASCPPITSDFDITLYQTPVLSNTFSNLFDCVQVNSLPTLNTNVGTANYYTYDAATNTYTPLTFPITTTTEIHAFADNNICRSVISVFTVYIGSLNLPNIDLCSAPYTLTAPPIGEYRDAPNGGGNRITTPAIINQNSIIYHYVPGFSCTDDDFFTITFNQPLLTPQNPVAVCENYTLPVNPDGARYFEQPGGPTVSGNTELFANTSTITNSRTLWIYKESSTALTPICYNEIPWDITIYQKPVIDSRSRQEVCYSYTLTPLSVGAYYDDPNGQNPITDFVIDASDLNANDDLVNLIKTIYIYAANPNDPTCFSQNSFEIDFDSFRAPVFDPQVHCDSYTLPPLPANTFYYDAPMDPNPLNPHPGNIIPAGTTYTSSNVVSPLYIYTETNVRFKCRDESSFTITINNTPSLDTSLPATFNSCDTFTLPALSIGKYYNQSVNVPNGRVEIPITTYDVNNPPPSSVFVYAETGTTPNCWVEKEIPIYLYNVTELTDLPNTCNSYQLDPTALKVGENYYDVNGNPLASNAIINTPGANIIYIRGNAPFAPYCQDQSDFTINIVARPVANPASIASKCDDYGVNDGIYRFDLITEVQSQVLGAQQPITNFAFDYYTSSADANTGLNAIVNPSAYENETPYNDAIWVRISNNTSINPCYDIVRVDLRVNPLPKTTLASEYFICEDYETGTLLNSVTLDTGLRTGYTFDWTQDGVSLTNNSGAITTNQVGNYTVTITNNTTLCSETFSTKVTKYSPYLEIIYSDAFETPSFIQVNVLGAGSGHYEYQIDNGMYQDNNVFYNVSPGEHLITVRDKDGYCSPAPLKAFIINYPKFFTPNADGYNETWNIPNLALTNPDAKINIFDRFGKLIKQITPSGPGWDGTYNGEPLPSTDYWFTVDYSEKGSFKTFRAHFSLKR
ncbi:T9SS type B sorting domain-containing protein [Flavobacterium luminosum]|uniref:T9SS type B sorting domain-containing protein n=1 Tax=Flavobacterium luminosum TaxID=2949086 RepID=A0ABT0TKL9_9FLAO|nr:choice-of-anchor L domain-containing protein [Flavobacterium sp. HXWNR70]MCL9807856.1 T9SS type B sorting domain-containing protein [Flavobacterium sp. HXWNR70]